MEKMIRAHGTAGRYISGACRCRSCKDAWATYCRDRARRLGRKPRRRAYYAGRLARSIAVRPTPLGLGILAAAEARTGLDRHDIIERLLREAGPRVAFAEDGNARTCCDG